MPCTSSTHASSQRNVKSRFSYDGILRVGGLSHEELCSLSIEARRRMYLEAVEAERMRLPEDKVREVFNDLEFDPETGEVYS